MISNTARHSFCGGRSSLSVLPIRGRHPCNGLDLRSVKSQCQTTQSDKAATLHRGQFALAAFVRDRNAVTRLFEIGKRPLM
jgi:hypothetical protein